MEIFGWIVWFLTFAFGLWSFIAFLYEVFWPSDGPEVLQVMYPFYLRRLIAGFEALGFISAAIVVILIQVSKFHLLWFAPVWYFWGLPRWFEWIYLYFNPELIDLIYPETDISWWFSILCPFSPSLVPGLIRKIQKSHKRELSVHDSNGFHIKYVKSIDKTLNADEFNSLALAKNNNWPPTNLEALNKIQRVFFWLGAGAFLNLTIMLLLFLISLICILLGLREASDFMPIIFGAIKYTISMICIVFVTWVFIYIFRDKK